MLSLYNLYEEAGVNSSDYATVAGEWIAYIFFLPICFGVWRGIKGFCREAQGPVGSNPGVGTKDDGFFYFQGYHDGGHDAQDN